MGPHQATRSRPKGLTLGILGLGGIGSAVAKRAAPFGLKLQYHNQSPARASAMSRLNLGNDEPKYDTALDWEEGNRYDERKHIIINTARGPIIDESALVQGLERGKIWSVGLDVFEQEPEIHPGLMKNENAILLPHIGTATIDTRKCMEVTMLDNVKNGLFHKQLLTPVPEHAQAAR
ncbi:unnamed protein product [Clonostachys rosea f. rosea IK726]|uniref:Uncharacterized protein n=1 Tax=Clonostachys rosea f. rosea IK726 TaxID=1349383 RepID=A0ACA9U8S2_BIOOC|nr:unnamed protein product [Clonostachys rosea f. rosea IK726]